MNLVIFAINGTRARSRAECFSIWLRRSSGSPFFLPTSSAAETVGDDESERRVQARMGTAAITAPAPMTMGRFTSESL